MKIFPSLIASNVLNLEHIVKTLEPFCDGFHVDVMDWHFVPNLTMGPLFINPLAKTSQKPLLIHLMIEHVKPFLSLLQLRSIDTVSFHIELKENISEIIDCLREKKWRASLAINPKTPLDKTFPFLGIIDHVLLMAVDPGFSGQQFIESSWDRLKELVNYRKSKNLSFLIEVDGGVNKTNIRKLSHEGADAVTMGSGIFGAKDPRKTLRNFKELII